MYDIPARYKGSNEADSAQCFLDFYGVATQLDQDDTAVKGSAADTTPTSHDSLSSPPSSSARYFDDDLKQKVFNYILATIEHQVLDSPDSDLQLFIDIDMAVLGRDRQGYQRYAAQIRREYSHTPARLYCRGRAAFLEAVVDCNKPIFASQTFRDGYEALARKNLQWEVKQLREGVIPGGEVLPTWGEVVSVSGLIIVMAVLGMRLLSSGGLFQNHIL